MAVYRRAQTLRHRRVVAFIALALASGCAAPAPDNGLVCKLWAAQSDEQGVVATGTITGPIDKGFLLQLTGDCDLLVRVDTAGIAAPAPPNAGATVIVRGDYAYNAMGGALTAKVVQSAAKPSN